MLVDPAVSGWRLSLLCACKSISAPLGDWLSTRTECCGTFQLLGAGGAWTEPVLAALPLLCVLSYTSLLSRQREDGSLISKTRCQITPCREVLPWQDPCTDSCGAAQLLGACGALADPVPALLALLSPVLLAIPALSVAGEKMASTEPS